MGKKVGGFGLNAGASTEGLLMSAGKVGLGAVGSSALTGVVSRTFPQFGLSDEVASVLLGMGVAKFVDKEIGVGMAVGGLSPTIKEFTSRIL